MGMSMESMMTREKTIIITIAFSLLLLSISGCGGNPRVSGNVTYSDDHSPITSGTVMFAKDGYTGRAEIGKNGHYSVSSESDGAGLPPGTYRVYLEGTAKATVDGGGVKIEHRINPKYYKPDTSGLSLTVEKSQTYHIEVERYAGQ